MLQARETGDGSGDAGVDLPVVGYPGDILLIALDASLYGEAPVRIVRIEVQRLEGDRHFRCPTLRIDAGRRMPDALPVPVDPRGRFEHRVRAHAVGVDLELVSGSVVVERVDNDVECVIPAHVLSLRKTAGQNLVRFGVPHPARDVEIVVVVEQVHRRLLGRLDMIRRPELVHVVNERGVLPGGIVEGAVDGGRGSRAHDPHDLVRAGRCVLVWSFLCRSGCRRQEHNDAKSYPIRISNARNCGHFGFCGHDSEIIGKLNGTILR